MSDGPGAAQQAASLSAADPPSAANADSPAPSTKSSVAPTTVSNSVTTRACLATPNTSASPVKPSPNSSRNNSPTRKTSTGPPHTVDSARAKSAALSPNRPGASTPSAAAVQRALSAANVELLRPSSTSELPAKGVPRLPQRTEGGTALKNVAPPVSLSPRTKSPPSSTSSRRNSLSSAKTPDTDALDASKSLRHQQAPTFDPPDGSSLPAPPNASAKALRGPSGLGSKLETVEEADHSGSLEEKDNAAAKNEEEDIRKDKSAGERSEVRKAGNNEVKAPQADAKAVAPPAPSRQRSNSSLAPAKTRSAHEGSSGTMIVETETVSSIPQTVIGGTSERAGGQGGSLRAKPSTETIRPKKEKKKKIAKKPPSIISTAGSSKADIFEAKVASEIEGGGSDSDETFVYESNPPESRSRSSKHHSRTPSSTSIHTLGDSKGNMKSLGSLFTSDRPVRSKRSMKFASNSYASSMDDESTDYSGTIRASNPRSTPRHEFRQKQMNRIGRDKGGPPSPMDADSPYSQASKLKNANFAGSCANLKSGSPRSITPTQSKAFSGHDSTSYSYDSAEERSPLLGTIRTPRTRNSRNPTGSHLRHMEYYVEPRRDWMRRLWGCVVLSFVVVLLVLFGAGLLFATARPLYGVRIEAIQNVLASEQALMLDLRVEATNPNIAQITITDMDLNVFAKSRHVSDHSVGISGQRHARTKRRRKSSENVPHYSDGLFRMNRGVDDGTDPIEDPDPEADRQTMLLGRIFHFDSPISFDGSPVRRESHGSTGELRLPRPGNKTETGGSARWERVIDHPFELLVRGVLKYQLPLSSHVMSSSVGAWVPVHPEDGADGAGSMRVVQIAHLEAFDFDTGQR